MRKTISSTTCVAVALAAAVAVAAQTPPDQPKSESAAKTVTVSGCVQRASSSGTAGTTGTAGAAGAAAKFELTNAKMTGAGASETAGTSGAAGMAATYELDATESEIAAHVGHQVEVTGTLTGPPSTAGASGTTPATPGSRAAAQKLKVQSVKMVSATCKEG